MIAKKFLVFKKVISLFTIFSLVSCTIFLLSCAKQEEFKYTTSTNHRIIIDSDTAGDDAMAIALCAKAPNVIIEGVTVLAGNVNLEQGAKNALMTLEMAGKPDVPVYEGVDTTYDGELRDCYSVFGVDGMGDKGLINPKGKAKEQNAVDFIIDTVKKYPNEIEILAIGPATNIALAIKKDKDTMKKVKRIYSMGTTGFGPGNATPIAEFNVFLDPKAYEVMLSAGIPITIIGLLVCEVPNVLLKDNDLESLSKQSKLGKYLVDALSVLKDDNKKNNIDHIDICDAIAAAALIWDNFIKTSEDCDAYVCLDKNPTFGQVIFYRKSASYVLSPEFIGNYNKTVVKTINSDIYKEEVEKLIR